MSRKIIIAISCIALCVMQVGCNRITATRPARRSATRSKMPALSVPVITVQQKTVSEKIIIPASIEGYEQANLMAKIDAYVKTVHVNIGDEVEAGAILIDLAAPELKFAKEKAERMVEHVEADLAVRTAELRAAEAKTQEQQAMVDLRQSEHARFEKLVGRGALKPQKLEEAFFALKSAESKMTSISESLAVARSRVEMASTQIEVAEAEVAEATAIADYLRITAPFSGVITRRTVDPGAFVRPATSGGSEQPMLIIAHVDKMRVIVHLTMDQAAKLTDGDGAVFSSVDVPGRSFPGAISRHAKSFDIGTRMMRAEVDLDNRVDEKTGHRPLRPGGYGTLTITVDQKNVPAIPKSALWEEAGDRHVVQVGPDGSCRHTTVQVAIEGKEWVGLEHGVRLGDRVVAVKPKKVKDKSRLAASEIKAWK